MHEVVLRGEERGPGAGRDSQLVVDVLHVVLNRFWRDREGVGNCLVRQPAGYQAQDLHPAVAQAAVPLAPRRCMPGGHKYGFHRLTVKASSFGLSMQRSGGLRLAQSRPIGARLCRCTIWCRQRPADAPATPG
jgi:hypothetical protein